MGHQINAGPLVFVPSSASAVVLRVGTLFQLMTTERLGGMSVRRGDLIKKPLYALEGMEVEDRPCKHQHLSCSTVLPTTWS